MDIAQAIKNFRQDSGQTQIQFAVALRMSATSIHRYEAGSGVPDLESLKKLHKYAVHLGNTWAERVFHAEIAERAGLEPKQREASGTVRAGGTVEDHVPTFELEGQDLEEKERLWVVALVLLMRHTTDPTAEQILETLLGPWLSQAGRITKTTAPPKAKRPASKAKPEPTHGLPEK